ncbi:NAD(P)H-hydrate dehydratase [Pseudoalteromonas phenolica]|uniref:NAD(P)H-hydrate dehydratase n=1 Tax=Pseudoalteromonas phenolica TaxID=161398 RepID=UPI00110AD65A|nr:NAD(P)H-hydrate dehydratase [Pseudoalteromonas phenolica]TMO55000.1 bifunctional ADP-dependent NAD(P)H-hydrate dehydratase/NAD(P)H-hydrate epimerase [Pseudoalteromonas phenolica]
MEAKYTANLPQYAYLAQQVQAYEAQAAQKMGLSLWQLMQRAGEALFCLFDAEFVDAERILILAGKGNNAGDAYLLAAHLQQTGRQVVVYSVFPPTLLEGNALKAYQHAKLCEVEFSAGWPQQQKFDVIVDGIFGTGFKGDLSAPLISIFNQCEKSTAIKVSIDVPSGVNANSSEVAIGAFRADVTLTFIALKQGLLTGKATAHCGRLYLAELGVAEAFSELVQPSATYLNQQTHLANNPVRTIDTYKNQCGHVLLIGGGKGMAGAIRLAAEACLRSGAGLVSVATHPDNVAMVLQGRYELMVHGVENNTDLLALMNKADVLVLGPGLGQSSWAEALFDTALQFSGEIVVDADGLNLLAKRPKKLPKCVLTPHEGEARRLLDTHCNMSARFEVVKLLHEKYMATAVLKGPGSLIYDGNCTAINRSGTAAMASAGMGDVLSGMIAALIAQGLAPSIAAQLAVYIHGLAAQIAAKDGAKGLLASDLFVYIRRLLG